MTIALSQNRAHTQVFNALAEEILAHNSNGLCKEDLTRWREDLQTRLQRVQQHPHIVRVHDLHELDGEPLFISMEYIDGPNLHELAQKRGGGAFSVEEVLGWTRQLCAPLASAHSRGVIHRDLKPANLMLDSRMDLKLADFGLAAAFRDPADSLDEGISGTPAYMSPQQLAGAPAAITDDIYSLRACLFELLSGVLAFHGPGIHRQIQFQPAPLLSETMEKRGLRVDLPEALEETVLRCLSKNPQKRPQSSEEILKLAMGVSEEEKSGASRAASEIFRPERVGNRLPWWKRKLAMGALVAGALLAIVILTKVSQSSREPILDLRSAPVRSSSFQSPGFPEGAFDGLHRVYNLRDSNRWVSASVIGDATEWIAVDLGRDMRISSVTIDWELAYAKDFSLRTQTSAEGWDAEPANWTERGSIESFLEISITAINDVRSETDVVFDFARGKVHLGEWMRADQARIGGRDVAARYVMIQATAKGPNNPGVYSIHEIKIAAKPISN